MTASVGAGAVAASAIGPFLPAEAASRADREQVRLTMRKLWEDHVVWTRMVIVAAIAGSSDVDSATQRLLANQDDIGDAIAPFFGHEAGAGLAALLREHILIAAEILAAATSGDSEAFDTALASWYVNGDDVAGFLHTANPRSWPLGHMKAMMREHLDLTLAEATARLNGDWDADVRAYDRVHDAILRMADMITDGLLANSGHRSH
jgi:hypothetical protein